MTCLFRTFHFHTEYFLIRMSVYVWMCHRALLFFIFSLDDFTVLLLYKMARTFRLAYKLLPFSLSTSSFLFCTKSQVNFIKHALNKIYLFLISKLEESNAKKNRTENKTQQNVNGRDILIKWLCFRMNSVFYHCIGSQKDW